ncbi:LysR family transcriptional regulator [Pseudomonas gingeri]|uniref:LysR family transcriptional regulator n=1 Tax=Pseudomonas gingeri TaxID=117681 RepID=UPI0015A456D1|nr:LysR family transcriptional regulator [Pseudomonas gingeri]NWA24775.1 LysR family transcriptional regulator [Pseudomonas gingeri]NWD71606.1 LysR family transcriptional regulator [Pseudomonas gingeri]NWD74735.1 LysR family transcriptional regulator [Pseudomonas gingeri]
MRTDLNLLRVLLAIHEAGNVTTAAQHLGMSQPAVSAALSRLRHSLGDALFVRSGSRMEATPRAQSIIERTREVIDIIDRDILSNPTFDPAGSSEEFTFCLSEVGEVVFLPTLFEHLRKVAPKARIRTFSLSPKDLTEHLREGKVDMVLGYFPDLDAPNIYQQRLFSHDLVCLIRRDHPITEERLSLEDFCALEHLQVRDGSRSQEMYESHLAALGVKRNIVLQMSHYMSTSAIIERSDLVVVLPRSVARLYTEESAVRTIEPPVDFPSYDLKQHWHARFQKDPRHMWLRQTIRTLFVPDE